MDLGLSKKGDYAVRASIALARNYGNGYVKIKDVADQMALPVHYTPQILGMLARADLAEARAGRDGGYRLMVAPAEISLLEIVEAAEGPLESGRCTLRGGPCEWDNHCPVHPAWVAAREALRRSLGGVSLASIAAQDKHLLDDDLKSA